MKKILAIAVAAAFAAPAIATADTTLYGKINAQLMSSEIGTGDRDTDMKDNGSRVGIKGSTPLDNGLAATYKLEYTADTADNNGGLAGTVRQSYVGLKGGFGEIRAGSMYGPVKLSTGKVEMFVDRVGDYNGNFAVGAWDHDNNAATATIQRDAGMQQSEGSIADSIAYVNKFGNVGVAVLASEDQDRTEGMLNYSNNGLYLAAAHGKKDSADTTRLAAAYKFPAGHQVGAAYETHDTGVAGASDQDSYVVSGKYNMGKIALKAQHQETDYGRGAGFEDASLTTIGMDYKLGKKTVLNMDISDGEQAGTTGVNNDVSAYAVGIMHSF